MFFTSLKQKINNHEYPDGYQIINPRKNYTILSAEDELYHSYKSNKNVMIVGTSGSGKTRSFMIPNVMQKNASMIITDGKGDIYKHCADYLRSDKGGPAYKVKVLDLFRLNDNPECLHYNPLNYIQTSLDIVDFVYNMVHCSINGDYVESSEHFWDEEAMNLLTVLVGSVIFFFPEHKQNMDSMFEIFSHFEYSDGNIENKVLSALRNQHPDSFIWDKYDAFVSAAASDGIYGNIMAEVSIHMSRYQLTPFKEITRYDELGLEDFGDVPTALFVIYDDTDPTKNFLLNLLYSQIFKILYRKALNSEEGCLNHHVRFYLDDFASVKIPEFPGKLANMRSREISACIAFQNMSQLNEIYGPAADVIRENCETKIFTGTSDHKSADDIAKCFDQPLTSILRMDAEKYLIYCDRTMRRSYKYDLRKHPGYGYKASASDNAGMSNIMNEEDEALLRNLVGLESLDEKDRSLMADLLGKTIRKNDNRIYKNEKISTQEHSERVNMKQWEDYMRKDEYDGLVDGKDGDRILYVAEEIDSLKNTSLARRASWYDSPEEEEFYEELRSVVDAYSGRYYVEVHEHLNEFVEPLHDDKIKERVNKRLWGMHVDFAIHEYSSDRRVVAGIEINTSPNSEEPEDAEKEKNIYDIYKDTVFEMIGIPLYRVPFSDKRGKDKVISDIKELLEIQNKITLTL